MGELDLILRADRFHTMQADVTDVRAVGIRDGEIVVVGADAADWRSRDTLDLGDVTVTPGLTDAHIHPIMGVELTAGADLSGARTLAEARALVGAKAAELADGDWLLAWGLDPNILSSGTLTGDVFDDAARGLPLFVRLFDGHSALANRAGLAAASITGRERFDEMSSVECDEHGRPTGLLLEFGAMDLVRRVLPALTAHQFEGRLSEILSAMAASGITGGHAMDFIGEPVERLRNLEARGELPIRLRFSPWCNPGATEEDRQSILRLQRIGGRRWEVAGVKLFIDGTIDNGTAWLRSPDTHGESRSSLWPDPAEYTAAVSWFHRNGIPTATHAIGDAGLAHVLETLAKLRGWPRHRVEHIETASAELVARFAELGVAASMQPTHCTHYTSADASDNWSERLGPGRTACGWPIRGLRDSGAIVALGSDWPIAPFDPRAILADAQLRRPAGHLLDRPRQPGEALTARMALEGYTTHAAAAIGESARSGVIAPGARADFTVFGADPLVLAPDELAEIPIVATIIGGSVQYRGAGYRGEL